MEYTELLGALWRYAPFVFALWLIAQGRIERKRGELPSRLYLRNEGRQLQGLCVGIAEYFGLSVILVRLIALTIALTNPYGVLAYLLLGVSFPWHEADRNHWSWKKLRNRLSHFRAMS